MELHSVPVMYGVNVVRIRVSTPFGYFETIHSPKEVPDILHMDHMEETIDGIWSTPYKLPRVRLTHRFLGFHPLPDLPYSLDVVQHTGYRVQDMR